MKHKTKLTLLVLSIITCVSEIFIGYFIFLLQNHEINPEPVSHLDNRL
jgi:hypothetical protein